MSKRALSLPVRLSLAVTLVLVATMLVADGMAMLELRKTLAASVSGSLSGMIGRMASQLDDDIGALLRLAEEKAREVDAHSTEEAGAFLRRNAATLGFAFDYGVILVDASGGVVADSLGRTEWKGIDLAGEEFFQRTFALKRPLASEPFASPLPDATPVAMFTAPVFDAEGRPQAVLAGGIDLRNNRSINQPTGVRATRYGQIGLFTADGVVVAHSRRELILEHYENPGGDSDIPDSDGAVEITASDGTPTILAVARLRNADWVLAGAFPSREVNAPIEAGFAAAHRWFAAGLALSCLLTWLAASRSVRDLGRLDRELSRIGDEALARGEASVGGHYRDEAGAMAGTVNSMLGSLARARREIGELSSRLAHAQERERKAIAEDLHDSVCQSLALANMRLGGLRKRLRDDAAAAATAGEIQAILENSVAELRSLIFNLSPNILYELGLMPALEWFAETFSSKYGPAVTLSGDGGEVTGLREEEAIFLYRAVGELTANAAKHAGASAIGITAGRAEGTVFVEVFDDGRGMDGDWTASGGFGLRNLRERTRQFGGDMRVESGPGGTRVRIGIPVEG